MDQIVTLLLQEQSSKIFLRMKMYPALKKAKIHNI